MILCLAPHMDDEVHCAGYLARGEETLVVAFSCCDSLELIGEWHKSLSGADGFQPVDIPVRQFSHHRQLILDTMIAGLHPATTVLCPSSTDIHQDHQVIHQEAMRAFRNVPLLLGYECPGNQRESKVNVFVELQPEHLAKKIEAWNCYKSQHHRTIVDWEALAKVRGGQCRCESGLAEGYELLSMRI